MTKVGSGYARRDHGRPDVIMLLPQAIGDHAHRMLGRGVHRCCAYPGDPDLIDAACRLVRLLDRPETIGALAPLIEREILYRLVNGPHGPMLRHVATAGSQVNQVSRAIAAIRRQFDSQIRIEDVAAEAGMSPSSLHAHFKAVTHMTPLEYQKQLRLQEARRLMLVGGQRQPRRVLPSATRARRSLAGSIGACLELHRGRTLRCCKRQELRLWLFEE